MIFKDTNLNCREQCKKIADLEIRNNLYVVGEIDIDSAYMFNGIRYYRNKLGNIINGNTGKVDGNQSMLEMAVGSILKYEPYSSKIQRLKYEIQSSYGLEKLFIVCNKYTLSRLGGCKLDIETCCGVNIIVNKYVLNNVIQFCLVDR